MSSTEAYDATGRRDAISIVSPSARFMCFITGCPDKELRSEGAGPRAREGAAHYRRPTWKCLVISTASAVRARWGRICGNPSPRVERPSDLCLPAEPETPHDAGARPPGGELRIPLAPVCGAFDRSNPYVFDRGRAVSAATDLGNL